MTAADAEAMASERLRGESSRAIQQLGDSNIGGMIHSLAQGIAQAQFELDMKSVQIAQLMSGQTLRITNNNEVKEIQPVRLPFGKWSDGTEATFSLMELGFTPTFYQFVETVVEVKLSISMKVDTSIQRSETSTTTTTQKNTEIGFFKSKTTTSTHVNTVSSQFSAKFQYSVEGSSYVRTKLVPVPPPESLLQAMREAFTNV